MDPVGSDLSFIAGIRREQINKLGSKGLHTFKFRIKVHKLVTIILRGAGVEGATLKKIGVLESMFDKAGRVRNVVVFGKRLRAEVVDFFLCDGK